MKIKHSKPKGQRLLKSNHKRPLSISIIGDWWFLYEENKWVNGYPSNKPCVSSYAFMRCKDYNDVYSLKAAIRKINKWDVPKGTVFKICLPYKGYDIEITK